VRYRGLKKNGHRLLVTCALVNLFVSRKKLLAAAEAVVRRAVLSIRTEMAPDGMLAGAGRCNRTPYVTFLIFADGSRQEQCLFRVSLGLDSKSRS
jgi:hypothetical protein